MSGLTADEVLQKIAEMKKIFSSFIQKKIKKICFVWFSSIFSI